MIDKKAEDDDETEKLREKLNLESELEYTTMRAVRDTENRWGDYNTWRKKWVDLCNRLELRPKVFTIKSYFDEFWWE